MDGIGGEGSDCITSMDRSTVLMRTCISSRLIRSGAYQPDTFIDCDELMSRFFTTLSPYLK